MSPNAAEGGSGERRVVVRVGKNRWGSAERERVRDVRSV